MPNPDGATAVDVIDETIASARGVAAALIAFSLGVNLLMLAVPLYMLQVFDRVISSRSGATLVVLTLIVLGALVAFGMLEFVRSAIVARLGRWFEQRVSGLTLAATIVGSQGAASRSGTMSVEMVRNYLASGRVLQLLDIPWTPIFLLVIFLLHGLLGWVALFGWASLIGLSWLHDRLTRRRMGSAGNGSKEVELSQALVRNADSVESMGMLPAVVSNWIGLHEVGADSSLRIARTTALFLSVAKFWRLVLQVMILGSGAWLVIEFEITPGAMIAASILMARALAPMEQAVANWRSTVQAKQAYTNIRKLLEVTPMRGQATPLPRPDGNVVFDKVTYTHPNSDAPVIRGVTGKIAAGGILGLVGPTGSGKTTLGRLLVGVVKPRLGNITLGGREISSWEAEDRGQYVGYLPQVVELLPGTIVQNIGRFGDHPVEMAIDAARKAGVHDLILGLPDGYDTIVGEGGFDLSAGHRQRVGLARALYGDPVLVVLDEPNAHLDMAGEAALGQALSHLRSIGATVVLIAHRAGILKKTDKMLILNGGITQAFGPTSELLGRLAGTAEAAKQ